MARWCRGLPPRTEQASSASPAVDSRPPWRRPRLPVDPCAGGQLHAGSPPPGDGPQPPWTVGVLPHHPPQERGVEGVKDAVEVARAHPGIAPVPRAPARWPRARTSPAGTRGIRVKMRLHLGRQGPRDHPRGPPLPAPVEGRGHSPLARRSLGGFHPLRRLPARACGHTNRVCRIQPVPPRASRPPATARRGHPCAPVPCPDLSRASGCRRPWALPRCAHPEGDHPRGWLPGPQGDRCPRAAQTPESSSRRL